MANLVLVAFGSTVASMAFWTNFTSTLGKQTDSPQKPVHKKKFLPPKTRLPVFDVITIPYQTALLGSFRIREKTDFTFAVDPEIYISTSDVVTHPSTGVVGTGSTKVVWQRVTNVSFHVEAASDETSPCTEAIVGFGIPSGANLKINGQPAKSLAVVMEGDVDEGDPGYETASNIRHEWSFAICPIPINGRDALGTNGIVPITNSAPSGAGWFGIGNSNDTIWLNDFFKGWIAGKLDCSPRIYVDTPGTASTPTDFLNKTWRFVGKARAAASPRRPIDISSDAHNYQLIYSPDYSDFAGRRYFQISGVVRRLTPPYPGQQANPPEGAGR